MKDFSIQEVLGWGFEKTKKNFWFFVPITLLIAVLNLGAKQSQPEITDPTWGIILLVAVLISIIRIIVDLGTIKIALNFVEGKKSELTDIFYFKPLLNYVLSSLIFVVIIIAGFILLIIPGIILALKLQYYSYFIVDKNQGPIEALKSSWEITKGIKMRLFWFQVSLLIINILGILALVVGVFWTIPTTILSQAYLYKKLSSK